MRPDVAHREPALVRRGDHPQEHAIGAAHGELAPSPVGVVAESTPSTSSAGAGERGEVAVGVHGDDRVGADRFLSSSGVPSARILP